MPTIGLEIHAELHTKSKMFCDSKNDPEEQHPNINICPVCMGHPGTLPVINKAAVEYVILVGFAVRGEIANYTQFDRKNYFYPDLPKGYQISQYKHPLVMGGHILLSSGKKVRITRVHLEEDAGTLIHDDRGGSLVNFNRAGVPLLELVTEPDITTGAEAMEFAKELQLILRYVGASRARMERGEMRVEANVSIAKKGGPLGTKVEVKNLNSFKAVARAIAYEAERQEAILEKGEKVIQETRGWDEKKQHTVSQRSKEEAHDYRYFPEPDLPPLKMDVMGGLVIEEIRRRLPELPQAKRERFMREYGFGHENAGVLVADRGMAAYFEAAHTELAEWAASVNMKDNGRRMAEKLMRNYLLSDLTGLIKEKELPWSELLMTPENFAELIKMVVRSEVSSRGAKDLLRMMVEEGGDPSQLAEEKGLLQTSDTEIIARAIAAVKAREEKAVKDFLGGNEKILQFLVGQTMREMKNLGASANPQVITELWKKREEDSSL